MRKIRKIIIHCSDSEFGNASMIDSWHKAKGWTKIGYHYVICNGYLTKGKITAGYDGKIQTGRAETEDGAHCLGHNADSIGICLIGVRKFTEKQFANLRNLILEIRKRHGNLPVYGHCYFDKEGKTCPNFDVPKWTKENNL